MGVSLQNKDYCMDMGYITFFNLRKTIAYLYSPAFGDAYVDFVHNDISEDEMNSIIGNLFRENVFNEEDNTALDFLFKSDCEGKISYRDCRRLLKVIGEYTDNYMYGYVQSNHTFDYFKDMLKDCVLKRRNLYWD